MSNSTRPRRFVCAAALMLALCGPALASQASAAQPGSTPIRLWPGKAPGEQGEIPPEKATPPADGKDPVIQQLTNVSDPSLAVFPAPADKANGTALIVAPGGGYNFLAWDHEGEQIARWFNGAGVTAFVLKYRVPRRSHDPDTLLPLMDAQRAVSIVRHRAAEWKIDPQKIGMVGFSAGANLAVNASNHADRRAYEAMDEADRASCRPDFAVLIYPGGLLDRQDHTRLAAAMQPSKETPPSFVAVASDDRGSAEGSIRYFLALREAGVKSELHVYAGGGHGFGIRARAGAAATWPERCVDWMRGLGFLPAVEKQAPAPAPSDYHRRLDALVGSWER
jgi:acetyl esterase/lipase